MMATRRFILGADTAHPLNFLQNHIMTESEFLARADAILDKIHEQVDNWFETLDIDLDASRSGQVLTIVFDQKSHVVVNSQAPLQEMWVAAPSGGFHYKFDNTNWVDTRTGTTLQDNLSSIFSDITARALTITL